MKKSMKIITASLLLTLFGVFSLKVIEEHDYIEKIPTKYLLNGVLDNDYRTENDNFDYYLISNTDEQYDGKYAVSLKENVDGGSYTIPLTYNSKDVIGIYRYGFAKKSNITVTIPTSIQVIDYEAFFCTTFSNKDLDIPYTVEKMGTAAFFKTNIKTLNFLDTDNPSSWGVCDTTTTESTTETTSTRSALKEIPDFCFAKCSDLESITFSNSLMTIKEEAFEYCSSLSTVAFLGGLKNIGERAFNACSDLSKVYLPSSLFSKANDTFDGSIGDFAFANCDSDLKFQASTNEDTYTSFQTTYASFDRKSDFSSETYEYEFTSGDVYANGTWLYELTDSGINILKYIGNLSSDGIMAFPDKINSTAVTTIDADCISDYQDHIKRIYFPKTLTQIPDNFFNDNYKYLTYIGCMSGNNCYDSSTTSIEQTIDLSGLSSLTTIGKTAFGKNGFVTTTDRSDKKKFITLKLPGNLQSIGKDAFTGYTYVSTFTMEERDANNEDAVLTIGQSAFENLGSNVAIATNDLVLPKGTKDIANKAFKGSLCIRSLKINGYPNGSSSATELSINSEAFMNCKNLQKVIIEDRKGSTSTDYKKVKLYENCFAYSSGDKNVDYSPNSLLQTIYLPNGVVAGDSSTNQFNCQYRAVIYYGVGATALSLTDSVTFVEKINSNADQNSSNSGDFTYLNTVAATKFNFNCEIPTYTDVTLYDYADGTQSSVLYDTDDFAYLLNPNDRSAIVTKYHFEAADTRTYTKVENKDQYYKSVEVKNSISCKNVSYTIKEIGMYAFAHSDSYTNINYWWRGAQELTYRTISSVELPNSIEKIGDYAFFRCVGLEGNLNMPSSLQSIGYLSFAFTGISSITSLNSDCSFTEKGSSIQNDYSKPSPFLNCPNLSFITLSNKTSSTLKLSDNSNALLDSSNNVWVLFPGYTSTEDEKKKFSFSSNTSKFHFGAFKTVRWIEELTISGSNCSTDSNGMIAQTLFTGYCDQTQIRLHLSMGQLVKNLVNSASPLDSAFDSSMVLKLKLDANNKLTIPDGAFMKSRIKKIIIPYGGGNGSIPRNFLNSIDTTNLILQVEQNSTDSGVYTNTDEKTNYLDFTDTGYKTIEEQAFYNSSFLTEINTGSVVTVGNKAFQNNSNLTTVTMPLVETIGDYAFRDSNNLENLTIPKVKSIGRETFSRGSTDGQSHTANSLKKVILPNTLLSIGDYAFSNCAIDSDNNGDGVFSIPTSVTTIGTGAFMDCDSLKKVSFKGSALTTIPSHCFDNCDTLESIVFPDNLTTIQNEAFWGCAFTELNFPSTITSIGNQAFDHNTVYDTKNYSKLTKITFADSTHDLTIGSYAFRDSKALTTIDFGNNSNSTLILGVESFIGCNSLTSLTLKDRTKIEIKDRAFKNCSSLKKIDIEKSTGELHLHPNCFENCSGLTSLYLGNRSMISVSNWIFKGCTSLETLTIGDADIKFWNGCFSGCTNLGTVNVESASTPLYFQINVFSDCPIKTLDFSKRAVYLGKLKGTDNNYYWGEDVSNGIFKNCTQLESVIFGDFDDGNYIGPGSFIGCTKLSSVTWGSSITNIGNKAFDSTALTKVDLSSCSKLTILNGFSKCTSLKSFLYPTSITSIGESCFSGSTSLTTVSSSSGNTNGVYLSSSIASIGNSAFSNCSAITIVKSEYTGELSLGSSVFSGCTSLTLFSQDTTGSLTYGENVFLSDSVLKYIVLPSNFNMSTSNYMLVSGLSQFSSSGDAYICFANGRKYYDFPGDTPIWVKINSSGSSIAKLAYYTGNGKETSGDYYEWSWADTNKTNISVSKKTVSSTSSNPISSSKFVFKRKEERLSF